MKSSFELPCHTERLDLALDAFQAYVAAKGFSFKNLQAFLDFWTFCGGINYETYRDSSFELETGKPRARRWLFAQLYRTSGGRYEVVGYIS